MDLNNAVRFAAKRISVELLSAGSILSIYSLASSFCVGFCALAYRQKKRRGRSNWRAIARAIFAKNILISESFHADVKLFVLSVVFMPVIVGGLVISTSSVATAVHAMLSSAFGSIEPFDCCNLTTKIASTVVLFLAYEIGFWVDHYFKHRIAFLWEFHKLHHTADVLTPLTNFRNHPIDSIVFGYMLAAFIGAAAGLLEWLFGRSAEFFSVDGKNIIFIIFLWTIGHLQHSQFWIPFGGVWGRTHLESRASSDPSFERSEPFQSQPRQRPRRVGLDGWNAGSSIGDEPSPFIWRH